MNTRERARRRFVAHLDRVRRQSGRQPVQKQVADALKVTQATVSRWEADGFSERWFDKVAALLGVTVGELTAPWPEKGVTRDVIGATDTPGSEATTVPDARARLLSQIAALDDSECDTVLALVRDYLAQSWSRPTHRSREGRKVAGRDD